jgi:hypothetical protein
MGWRFVKIKFDISCFVERRKNVSRKTKSVGRDGAVVAPHQRRRALAIVAGQPHFIIGFIRT